MTDTDVVKLFSSRASKSNHSAHRLFGTCFALADWMARNGEISVFTTVTN